MYKTFQMIYNFHISKPIINVMYLLFKTGAVLL